MDPGEERVVDQREYVSTGISVRVRYSEGPSYSSWIVADPSQATFTGISQQWVTLTFHAGSSVVTKRLRECVKYTQDYAVTAYWKKNGTVVYSKILMPGQQECYTFTYQSDETVTLESGFTRYDWGMTDYGPGLVQLTNWNDLDETQSSTSTNPPAGHGFVGRCGLSDSLCRFKKIKEVILNRSSNPISKSIFLSKKDKSN